MVRILFKSGRTIDIHCDPGVFWNSLKRAVETGYVRPGCTNFQLMTNDNGFLVTINTNEIAAVYRTDCGIKEG